MTTSKAPAPAPTTEHVTVQRGQRPAERSGPPPPMSGLLHLQRTAGNAAVSGLLAGTGPLALESLPNAVQGALTVQRQGGASGTWNAPEDLGTITDKGAARVALDQVLIKEASDYQEVDTATVAGVADQAKLMVQKLTEIKAKLDGEGDLPAEVADQLNNLSPLYVGFRNNARNALLAALKSGLSGLLNPPDMDEANEAVGEAMHALFMKPDEDKLEAIQQVAEKVKGISEKAKWVADKCSGIVKDLETAIKFHEISEKLEKFSGTIDDLINIKTYATDLITLVGGLDGKGSESILGAGAQLEAGLDLTTMIGKPFMSEVPLFGDYWNKYLVPMTKKCIELLNKLESEADRINRDSVDHMINWVAEPDGWRPVGPPPELPGGVYATLTGGRAVFEYLYLVMQGGGAPMSSDVEKVLLAHKESLESLTGSEMELEDRTWNPLTWFRRKPKDLAGWIAGHIQVVWMAFYGGGRLHL
jgi:hypothetical protein